MLSDRIQRQVDRLLDEAEEAIALRQWEDLRATCAVVLNLDPDNSDAARYLALADKSLTADVVSDSSEVIEAKDDEGWTPLHQAVRDNSLDVAGLLIDRGAYVEATNKFGSKPLHLAARNNSFETATLLIDRGANTENIDLSWMN